MFNFCFAFVLFHEDQGGYREERCHNGHCKGGCYPTKGIVKVGASEGMQSKSPVQLGHEGGQGN